MLGIGFKLAKMRKLIHRAQDGVSVAHLTIPLSCKEIVYSVINLTAAKRNLSEVDYKKVKELFQFYECDDRKHLLNPNEYLYVFGNMVDEFNKIAPWKLYNGDGRSYIHSARSKVNEFEPDLKSNLSFLEAYAATYQYWKFLEECGKIEIEKVDDFVFPVIAEAEEDLLAANNFLMVDDVPRIILDKFYLRKCILLYLVGVAFTLKVDDEFVKDAGLTALYLNRIFGKAEFTSVLDLKNALGHSFEVMKDTLEDFQKITNIVKLISENLYIKPTGTMTYEDWVIKCEASLQTAYKVARVPYEFEYGSSYYNTPMEMIKLVGFPIKGHENAVKYLQENVL